MARKRIDFGEGELIVGSALRHTGRLLEGPAKLVYDTTAEAGLNDVVLCEVVRLPKKRFDAPTHTGIEGVRRSAGGFLYSAAELREGLAAITVGNRYAPRNLTGGLDNPLTGKRNGIITGGSIVADLFGMNIAGFMNHSAMGEERSQLRVLGTLLDDGGAPLKLSAAPVRPRAARGPAVPVRTVVVTGNGMESGKTTVCVALANEFIARGMSVTFEKKTGSACVRDMMRVAIGRHDVLRKPGDLVRTEDARIPVCDFADTVGSVSDVSTPTRSFVAKSMRAGAHWKREHPARIHIIELADNLAHRTNLAFLANTRFRDAATHLIYVPDVSFDAADHALRRIRAMEGWTGTPLAFSGPLAADPAWSGLREELATRLKIPCLPARDAAGLPDGQALADWLLSTAGKA